MSSEDLGLRRKPNFPTKITIITILTIVVAFCANLLTSELNDWFGLAQDMLNVFTFLALGVLLLIWVGWFLLLSRMSWISRIVAVLLIVATPVVSIIVLRPKTGGDLSFNRIDPIWTSKPTPSEVDQTDIVVDLSVESPDDFPGFLGPDRNAIINTGQRIDRMKFTSGTSMVWKKPIGEGCSGFAARNGFAITMEQRGQNECVTCYEIKTGNLVWKYEHPARHEDPMHIGHVGPRSTPTIYDGQIYAVGAMGNLVCLNSQGTVNWQVDILELLGVSVNEATDRNGFTHQFEESTLAWGRSGSPFVTEEWVIVPGGGPRGGTAKTLLAFDRKTGDLKWDAGDEMIGYCSPTIATIAGREQILLIAETKVLGFDAKTGEQLWSHPWVGSSEGSANTSQPTAYGDNMVLLSKGYNVGSELIEVSQRKDGVFETETVEGWPNPRIIRTKLTNPVILDDHTYSLSDGFLECTSLKDAKRKWKRRGRFGHGQILLKDGLLIVHSEFGRLYLIEPSPNEYIELGNIPTIQGVCWNTICMSGPYVLVRSDIEAACFEFPLIPSSKPDQNADPGDITANTASNSTSENEGK